MNQTIGSYRSMIIQIDAGYLEFQVKILPSCGKNKLWKYVLEGVQKISEASYYIGCLNQGKERLQMTAILK